ncbi:MAG: DUF4381 domain-containing protein [Gammaproteobacteria bacterium]|nr:DUF4381 domain-containing protein [Gammaproteobacteria bacterium]MDH5729686.1 DUF4381 domain-containing protein [Gammaproteobacteria bacterium]
MDKLEQALKDLRDIHEPMDVSWWPPAIGWWILAIFIVLILVLFLRWFRRYRRRLKPHVMKEFLYIRADYRDNQNTSLALSRLSILLKRWLRVHSKEQVNGLQGDQWLEYLDQFTPTQAFTRGPGQLLKYGPYQALVDSDLDPLFGLIQEVIKKHA